MPDMPFLLLVLRFVGIFLLQLLAFFFFYNHPHGRRAVYDAWYAWIIDLLAIASGGTIMALSVYCIDNPWIFNVDIPQWVFWITFVIGGWQAAIHVVKWIIRLRR